MSRLIAIVTLANSPEVSAWAEVVASRVGLSTERILHNFPTLTEQSECVLVVGESGVELCTAEFLHGRGLRAEYTDLLSGRPGARLTARQPLAKALGRPVGTLLDATAGLGLDAARMAAAGWRTVACERDPVIFTLLEDGLRRALTDPRGVELLGDRLMVVQRDARDVLAEEDVEAPDVVYIDPMFPPRRKSSALSRKAMRLIRDVVGTDIDAADLLATARRHARRRVVVKRSDDGKPLAPDMVASHHGKQVRFDVYLPTA